MGQKLDELIERSAALPGLRRYARHHPLALKAEGSRIYDVDNHGYVDYSGGGGAAIVGYANQFILDAVKKVLAAGVPDGLHVPREVDLVEALGQFIPWAGTWFFLRNHDEALRAALRWAHLRTGKTSVVVLDGGDPWPMSGRVERGTAVAVREVPGWHLDKVEAVLTAGASKIAAFVIDPLMTRFGVIPPPDGALAEIAKVCRRNGILLILDEVVSGFRIHRGGAAGLYDVAPDMAVYGGALGAGFPIGAVALREGLDVEEAEVDDDLPVPHPVSLAAAEAVLSILKNDAIYERLEERTAQLVEGVLALAERFGRPLTINRAGSAFAIYMGRHEVSDRESVEAADRAAYSRFVDGMLAEGVLLPHRASGPAFVSHAHSGKEIEETLAACERVFMRFHEEDMP